jgi:hypothetical protein
MGHDGVKSIKVIWPNRFIRTGDDFDRPNTGCGDSVPNQSLDSLKAVVRGKRTGLARPGSAQVCGADPMSTNPTRVRLGVANRCLERFRCLSARTGVIRSAL